MKRPMATIGFSMLAVSLLLTNISFKQSVALLIGATVIFCTFLIFRRLRKYKYIIFSLFGVMVYIVSFIFTQYTYIKAESKFESPTEIVGVVCETPKETDYAFTYVIKLQNEGYKVRYVSEDNKMLRQGDVVSGVVLNADEQFEDVFFENSLSSKVYFTFFEGENNFIDKTGDVNSFYKALGQVKSWFTNVIDTYIPGENGAIAKAMTIGDKSEIADATIDNFNYAGTSHLLVISGLHLTLWSMGIMRFAERFSRLRKYMVVIGFGCLLGYSALTGFSVSVIRAGAMVGAVILGKTFNRDADSVNSVGLALTVILTLNPYATLSSALWFTVLSTLGILTMANHIIFRLVTYPKTKALMKRSLCCFLITTTVISISTTIFTLPVFVIKVGLLPIASFVSNIVMIDTALVLMILTVAGALVHSSGLSFIAEIIFIITGAISNFLKIFAEKIGLAQWSTLSVTHRYYVYFVIFAVIVIAIALLFRNHRKALLKTVSVTLSVVLALVSVYCTVYDYSTPSVDVVFRDSYPVLIANSKGESVVINPPSSLYMVEMKKSLNSHNEKTVDNVFVANYDEFTASQLGNLYRSITVKNTYFSGEALRFLENRSESNVKRLIIGECLEINAENSDTYIEASANGKKLISISSQNAENLIEKIKDYDIIILYGSSAYEIKTIIENESPDAKVFVSKDGETLSFYFK